MIVIEFMGLPRAGKTQTIEALDRVLRDRGFRVRLIIDEIKNAPIPADELEKNRWSIREVGNLISEARVRKDYDFILIDRGGWASWISVESLVRAGLAYDVNKARRVQKIAMDVVKDEDIFILIEASVPEVIRRHGRLGGSLNGIIMSEVALNKMNEINGEVKSRIPKKKSIIIDGEKNFSENLERVLNSVLSFVSDNHSQEGGGNGYNTTLADSIEGALL